MTLPSMCDPLIACTRSQYIEVCNMSWEVRVGWESQYSLRLVVAERECCDDPPLCLYSPNCQMFAFVLDILNLDPPTWWFTRRKKRTKHCWHCQAYIGQSPIDQKCSLEPKIQNKLWTIFTKKNGGGEAHYSGVLGTQFIIALDTN